MMAQEKMSKAFRAPMASAKKLVKQVRAKASAVYHGFGDEKEDWARAGQLNAALYDDVNRIPQDELERISQIIRAACQERNHSEELTFNWLSHKYRVYLTMKWLEPLVTGGSIIGLDMGGESLITKIWQAYFPHIEWQNTTGDLRYPWKEADNSRDLILSTEVVEHLSDQPTGFSDGFYYSGLRSTLSESYRVLKPGGVMLITTPNAGSIYHLKTVLEGTPPWFYLIHVREYTAEELLNVLQEIGFVVEKWQTLHCLTYNYHFDYTPIFHLLITHHFKITHRGDDIFIVVRKPG